MLAVAIAGGGSEMRCRFMEKQLIYSVRYSGEKHTLSFWLVNGRYMYSVDKKQQLRDLETGYKKVVYVNRITLILRKMQNTILYLYK